MAGLSNLTDVLIRQCGDRMGVKERTCAASGVLRGHGYLRVVMGLLAAAAVAAVGAAVSPAGLARSSCVPGYPGPTTVVDIRDKSDRVVARARDEPCGPASSVLSVKLSAGTRPHSSGDAALLRGGTCESPRPLPLHQQGLYERTSWIAPRIPAERLSRSSFVVILTAVGAAEPWACGSHRGSLSLPIESAPRPTVGKLKQTGRAYAANRSIAVSLTPLGSSATRIRIGPAGLASGGQSARLRPGTCRRANKGHEIVLQDAQMDFPSSTVVALPLAEIAKTPFALEILSDAMSNPWVHYCFEF